MPRNGKKKRPIRPSKSPMPKPCTAVVLYQSPQPPPRTRWEILRAVCSRIEQGDLIEDACIAEGTRFQRVWEWTRDDPRMAEVYMRARESSAEILENEALRVARSLNPVPRFFDQRLLVDTLKWAAAKRRPKVYSDRVDVTKHVEVTLLTAEERDARITELLAAAQR